MDLALASPVQPLGPAPSCTPSVLAKLTFLLWACLPYGGTSTPASCQLQGTLP